MLSEREKELLSLINLPDWQIAKKLFLSKKTLTPYFSRLYDKYNIPHPYRTRVGLLFRAIKAGDIKEVDLGWWDENDNYIPDIQIVDLRKE